MKYFSIFVCHVCMVLWAGLLWGQSISPLQNLSFPPGFESHRASSADLSGGNQDWIGIEPGETKVLADIQEPGAITHIWNTIDAEKYYSRMLILRFYWDGQETPSVEVPMGDFFGVGHGINRPFQSYPVNASSEGRARNCYWYMPFRQSAKVTVTHEGFLKVPKFYYYIDYRTIPDLPDDTLYFHAQYRQATPNPNIDLNGKNLDGSTNYVVLETEGKGQYAGSVVSVQMNNDGWFGEGDDMFFIDGSETPSITGTGTEDYFNDAWGFREFSYPYHGVTLWEGYKKGDRGTAYKWHIFDPVAFQKSLKVTIEHGHANNRQDDWYSVAYWYQTLPGPALPLMPPVFGRLPDEGQRYAKRIFLNKELALRIGQDQYQESLGLIDEFLLENDTADDYGYWSLRKGILLKQLGNRDEAEEMFLEAIRKSASEDAKAIECDAALVKKYAVREHETADRGRKVWFSVACADEYELFVDGEPVNQGKRWDSFNEFDMQLSRGKHVFAAAAKGGRSKSGFLLQMSSRGGYEITDSNWKCSNRAPEGWKELKFDDSKWGQAVIAGIPGISDWIGDRSLYTFSSSLILSRYIWAPDSFGNSQTLYFRKIVQVR